MRVVHLMAETLKNMTYNYLPNLYLDPPDALLACHPGNRSVTQSHNEGSEVSILCHHVPAGIN